MTELYIDRQLVVLPETFSITVIEENPFFTKNGKYTYDITLSLLDPVNARIYNHLNRINRTGDIPKDRKAYLVVDNEVVLNGTEVILEYTDTEVKIQLVSGNSELNFLIGGDKKLRELELGEAEKYTGSDVDIAYAVFSDMQKTYPQRNWQLIPFAYGFEEFSMDNTLRKQGIGNDFFLVEDLNYPDVPPNKHIVNPFYNGHISGQIPQPYLCYIIERVFDYFGYTIEKNSIAEHPYLRNIYIVHGYATRKFARMLPDWTVIEFLENIEKWLDCVFLIDKVTRKVRIIFQYEYEKTENKLQEITVTDEFSVETDEDNRVLNRISNIAYSLDSDDYYTFASLDEKVRNIAEEKKFDNLFELLTWFKTTSGTSVFRYIFIVTDTGDRFIAYQTDSRRVLKKVDTFKPLINIPASDQIHINLDIIPASMIYSIIYTYRISPGSSSFWVQVPVAGETEVSVIAEESEGEEINVNLQDTIEGSTDSETTASSKMRVAVFNGLGMLSLHHRSEQSLVTSAVYPSVTVDALNEYFQETQEVEYRGDPYNNVLRLEYLNNEIYQKTTMYDTTKIYKLTFIDRKGIDVMAKFVGNNRAYRCVKIERTITHKGFEKNAKGEFYPYL